MMDKEIKVTLKFDRSRRVVESKHRKGADGGVWYAIIGLVRFSLGAGRLADARGWVRYMSVRPVRFVS